MHISETTWRFVHDHRNEPVNDVALHTRASASAHTSSNASASADATLDLPFALNQIEGWQRAQRKLPEWAMCEGIVYPPHLAMEQCSSQFTAQYKASLAQRLAASAHPQHHTSHMVDLTGGFGVDFSYMARGFANATYVEQQAELCRIAEHNFAALGLNVAADQSVADASITGGTRGKTQRAESQANASATSTVTVINTSAEAYLDSTAAPVDLIFIDPARRDNHGARTYAIADCTPNAVALAPLLLKRSAHVMVKLSPMLDWHKAVADFGTAVREVHIVSTGNECKELLIVLGRDERVRQAEDAAGTAPAEGQRETAQTVRVCCVNDAQRFAFTVQREPLEPLEPLRSVPFHTNTADSISTATPQYLYEPNASIMKAGCFDLLAQQYGVEEISHNSHLFVGFADSDSCADSVSYDDSNSFTDSQPAHNTSPHATRNVHADSAVISSSVTTCNGPVRNFPGRIFAVDAVSGLGKRELRTVLKPALNGATHANIAVRNFPLSAAELRHKLGLRDGGDIYIFGTTTANGERVLLVTHKIQ